MDADVTARLRAGDVTVDAADAALLRAIDAEGSLNAAAEALGRSYSRAHKRLTTLESELGPLVERERGGTGGGGSSLTDGARETLARFARVRATLEGTAGTEEVVVTGRVRAQTGELVTVETAAGEVRAVAADAGADLPDSRVEVALTADAVTLQDPAASPGADATSARNRLRGSVEAVDAQDAIVTVTVDVGSERPLSVLVTEESRDRLGLRPGTAVVAAFKATAARATRPAGD